MLGHFGAYIVTDINRLKYVNYNQNMIILPPGRNAVKKAVVIALVLGAAVSPMLASQAHAETRIDAAGASFAAPLLDLWRVKYQDVNPEVTFNYQSIGSGGGVKAHIEKTVNFGATDAPLTDAEYGATPGTITIPEMIGAITMAYNIEGVESLNLSEEVLCGLYLGEITNWSDERITADNPDADLPDEGIATVHRSDGSGTTYAFTSYLSKTCLEWDERVGAAKSVSWPVGRGSPGNEGVAGTVRTTPNSIGYVTLAYAFQNDMKVANIQNGDHTNFVSPSIETASAASGSAAFWLPNAEDSWREVDLLAAPGPNSYPITSFSYLILHPDLGEVRSVDSREHAEAIVDLIAWIITDAQQYSPQLLYVPIADTVSNIGLRGLAQITYNGEPLYTGPTSVWASDTESDSIDAGISELQTQYGNGDMDQSTFLNIMAQIAELHGLYDQGLIGEEMLDMALASIIPDRSAAADDAVADMASGASGAIDEWVRTLAGWWAEGLVSDAEFVSGMEYLVEQSIITIGQP